MNGSYYREQKEFEKRVKRGDPSEGETQRHVTEDVTDDEKAQACADAFKPFNFPIDMRSSEEKDNDQHFEDFKDGLNDNCECSRCRYWREQERRDLEDV